MNTLNGTTRTIVVALSGMSSLALLGGCASGVAQVMAPKQALTATSTLVSMAAVFNLNYA